MRRRRHNGLPSRNPFPRNEPGCRLRILVLAQTPPWPETSGARIRLATIIRGLGQLGEIDLFVLASDPNVQLDIPALTPVRRVQVAARPRGAFTIGRRLQWLAGGRLPSAFAGRNYEPVRQSFAAWRDGTYDLVWCNRVDTYLALRPLLNAPIIVDVDDLENQKIASRLRAVHRIQVRDVHRPGRLARNALAWIQGTRNIRVWSELYKDIARNVAAAVVCSDLDALRLGAPNGVVVPNGYVVPQDPLGRVHVGQPPTIVLTGYFKYPPNVDGVLYFADEILPVIRAHLPTVNVRIAGDADGRVLRLRNRAGVTVTGFVHDIRSELAMADIVAVPVRYGSGTRIKILEAFAHRIPVVATPAAIEGIDAVHGSELLLGKTPEDFARHCVKLLTDERDRAHIVSAAYDLFMKRYRSDLVQRVVADLGVSVARRERFFTGEATHVTSERVLPLSLGR